MTFTVLSIANGQINETQNANDLERAVELASGKVSSICWVSFFHFMALLDDEKNTFLGDHQSKRLVFWDDRNTEDQKLLSIGKNISYQVIKANIARPDVATWFDIYTPYNKETYQITTGRFRKKPSALTRFRQAFYPIFGTHLNGVRNWFLLFILGFTAVGVLGALLPLAPVAVVVVIKSLVAFFLTMSLLISAKALSRDYEEVKKEVLAQGKITADSFSPLTYLQTLAGRWLEKSWRNKVQLVFGILLFLSVATVVLFFAFPAIGAALPLLKPALDVLTAVVTFLGQGFNVTMVASPLAVSIFLSAAILTGYDLFCRVMNWLVPIEEVAKLEALPVSVDVAVGENPGTTPRVSLEETAGVGLRKEQDKTGSVFFGSEDEHAELPLERRKKRGAHYSEDGKNGDGKTPSALSEQQTPLASAGSNQPRQ